MDEDELDFDFEQELQTQQSASTAAFAGPGGLVRLSCLQCFCVQVCLWLC